MAIKNRTQLKQYFETGKRPTQSQFADLIDSMALVPELPIISARPYKVFSGLLSCDGSNPMVAPIITLTELENEIGEISGISIRSNQISISFDDFQFDFEKTVINIGALNETCGFDKVIFLLNKSSESQLVFECISIKPDRTTPDDTIPEIPGSLDLSAISFEILPIEIRIYN